VNAGEGWLAIVRNKRAPLRDRMFYGLLTYRVHDDLLTRLAPFKDEYADDFNLSANARARVASAFSPASIAKSIAVRKEVVDLLEEFISRAAVEEVYGLKAPPHAEDGLRFFRVLVWNAVLSLSAAPSKRLSTQDLAVFTAFEEKGFVADMLWAYENFQHVVLVNNAWVTYQYLGKWTESVGVAQMLINNHEKLITESQEQLTPICADPSVWPGIAAVVLTDVRDRALDAFCGRLTQ